MNEQTYVGGELELFAEAHHWKNYWIAKVRAYGRSDVLEVGAGIGSNTVLLRNDLAHHWVCLEPDAKLAEALRAKLEGDPAFLNTEVCAGTLASLEGTDQFDTILYIDVLEHILDDKGELESAAQHLRPKGNLIVLSPAHAWLFSPFDRAIGHHRRYTVSGLRGLTPPGLRLERAFYLDSVGLLASAANGLLLRQSMPKPGQLSFWDNVMVPCSRILDPLTGYTLGKSVICIWTR